MRLAASLVVRNERQRYLEPCITHLLDFCDEIVVLDDASDDGSREYLIDHPDDRIHVIQNATSTFFKDESFTRQLLVDTTLGFRPTHVLSIDADEFVSDGRALRERVDEDPQVPVWSLSIEEVWKATGEALFVREDGGWRTHELSVLWRAPREHEKFTMLQRKLACRRVPSQVLNQRARPSGVALLHFGWADPATRAERIARYTTHDKGRFHASSHLRSLEWPESQWRLRERPWPEGEVFDGLRARLTADTVPA